MKRTILLTVCAMITLIGASLFAAETIKTESSNTEVPKQTIALNKGLWLEFNFEQGLAPSHGSFKEQAITHFERNSVAVGPDGVEVSENAPRFTDGLQGQGLYLGSTVRNLLSSELSDIDFEEGKIKDITPIGKTTIEQITTDDAWFGETCLKVSTPKKRATGIQIPITVSGGSVYIFSMYIKGKGRFALKISQPENKNDDIGPKRTIYATDTWTRHAVWIYATESTSATITLETLVGKKVEFFADALQLEKKTKLEAQLDKKIYPYGKDFSPNAWTPGRTKSTTDLCWIGWEQGGSFPIKEGSYSIWIKPEFYGKNCENRDIISRYYQYNQLTLSRFNAIDFARGPNVAENKEKSPVGRIRKYYRSNDIKNGHWLHLAATWSNKERRSRVYLNGKLLGEELCLIGAERTHVQRALYLGSYNKRSLSGTLDDVKIYSRELNESEVKKIYQNGLEHISSN